MSRPRDTVAGIVSSLTGDAPEPARRTIAYSGAFLYGSGATLVLVSLVVERSPGTLLWLAIPALAVAFLVSAWLILAPESLPVAVFPYLTALGTVLISILAGSDGTQGSADSLLYVWVALYSFYFYSLRTALLETALVSLAAAVELGTRSSMDARFSLWLLTTGTSLIGGLAIRQLVTQVRWLADRDGLTGLHNRRRLEEELERELRRADRSGDPLALLMLDLDEFKSFNDRGGHLEGDRHLREVAASWNVELRGSDMLARYGGEEFVVVMPACPLARAVLVADRLRSVTPNDQTTSVGAVEWDGAETATQLIARADRALYAAKLAGRDRTVVTGSGSAMAASEQDGAEVPTC